MNRSTARTMLRRRINETTADQWSDPVLNDILDIALQETQKALLAVDPEGVLYRSRIDIVASQALYKVPSNLLTLRRLKKLSAVSGLYEGMNLCTYDRAQSRTELADTDETLEFARFGQFLWILPTPTANQTAGLELDFVPLLTWGDDTVAPDLPLNLHYAVVLRAAAVALGETSEDGSASLNEWTTICAQIPSWYRPMASGGAPDMIQVDVGKARYA